MTAGQGQNNWPGPAPAAQPGPVQQAGAPPQHDPAQHGWAQQAPVQQQGQAPVGPWPGAPGHMGQPSAAVAAPTQHNRGAGWSGPQAPAQQFAGGASVPVGWSGPQAQGPAAQQLPGQGAVANGWSESHPQAAAGQPAPGGASVAPGWSGPQVLEAPDQQVPGAGSVTQGRPGTQAPGAPAQQVPGAGAGAPGWSGSQAPGAAAAQQLPLAAAGTAAAGWSGPQVQGGVAQLPGAGNVAAGGSGPWAQEVPAPPVSQAGPPVAGLSDPASGGSYAAASRRIPFPTLVLVELRKLTGTLSDRILLALAPVVLIGVTVLIHTATDYASTYASAQGQISPTFYTVRVGHVLLHAVLIKLIAGEWQHRSAQPTLLVQPSRARYFLAQATVVLMLWALAAVLQLVTTLLVAPAAITGVGAGYLLDHRIGWVVGVCVLGSLLTILVALTVAMLVPNAAGALAIYFATVPVMLTISGLAPDVFAWVDPSSATAALATVALVDGPGPVIASLVLWAGLLALAGFRVARRDLA